MIYEAKTKVYCTKLGPEFGTTIHCQVIADSIDQAHEEAHNRFERYIARLKKNHKMDFSYDYVSIVSPF